MRLASPFSRVTLRVQANMGTGCKLVIAELACMTMQLSTCWNNDGYGLDSWSTVNTVVGEC